MSGWSMSSPPHVLTYRQVSELPAGSARRGFVERNYRKNAKRLVWEFVGEVPGDTFDIESIPAEEVGQLKERRK